MFFPSLTLEASCACKTGIGAAHQHMDMLGYNQINIEHSIYTLAGVRTELAEARPGLAGLGLDWKHVFLRH